MTRTRILFTPPTLLAVALLALTLPVSSQPEPGAAGSGSGQPIGEALFARDCAGCHEGEGKSQGPSLAALQQMGSDQVMTSLTSGKMMEQAEGLSPAQILAIVSYLAGGKSEAEDAMPAIDLTTGAVRWSFQGTRNDAWNMACGRRGPNCPREDGPDFDFGAAPVLATSSSGRQILVAGQKSGEVHALDPDTGKVFWQNRLGVGSPLGGVHWGMTIAGDRVFVPIADPPNNPESRPGVYALDLESGELLWTYKAERGCELDLVKLRAAKTPWPECPVQYSFSAAPMSSPDVVFAGALSGKVFAFSAESGEILWQDHTVRPYDSINGIPAHGGAIDSSGVQLADDMLFVQSGYSYFGQIPGNALIAYRTSASGE